jgi:hypothetical protein
MQSLLFFHDINTFPKSCTRQRVANRTVDRVPVSLHFHCNNRKSKELPWHKTLAHEHESPFPPSISAPFSVSPRVSKVNFSLNAHIGKISLNSGHHVVWDKHHICDEGSLEAIRIAWSESIIETICQSCEMVFL